MDNDHSRSKREREKVARQTGRKSLRKARRKKRTMNVKYEIERELDHSFFFFIYKHHVVPF